MIPMFFAFSFGLVFSRAWSENKKTMRDFFSIKHEMGYSHVDESCLFLAFVNESLWKPHLE